MKRLSGKTSLVTGASRGIGRSIALRLAGEGALVAVHYGTNQDAAEAVVKEIKQNGGKAFAIQAEFGLAESVSKLFEALDHELQQYTGSRNFDILVNNAVNRRYSGRSYRSDPKH